MKGTEFVEKVKSLGRKRGVPVTLEKSRGKGSHSTLAFGDRFTTIPDLRKELKTGTFNALLKQLGLKKNEI